MAAPHPPSAVALLSLATTLLTACGRDTTALSAQAAPPPPSAALAIPSAIPSPAPAPAAAPKLADVPLAPQRFERAKLAFDGLADIKPDLTSWDVGGVFSQGRYLATHDEVFKILVRAHGDETLASFERDHQRDTLSARSPLQICGRSAELVRATHAEEHIACVMVAPPGHNHPAYIPPGEITAVAFEHDHLGVVLTVTIEAADPSAYRPLVDRVIASIRCL